MDKDYPPPMTHAEILKRYRAAIVAAAMEFEIAMTTAKRHLHDSLKELEQT